MPYCCRPICWVTGARQAPVLAHYYAMHANLYDSGGCACLGKQGEAGFGFQPGSLTRERAWAVAGAFGTADAPGVSEFSACRARLALRRGRWVQPGRRRAASKMVDWQACRKSCDKNHQKALCVATFMPSCARPAGQAAPHLLVWDQMDLIECDRAGCARMAQLGHSRLWFDAARYR